MVNPTSLHRFLLRLAAPSRCSVSLLRLASLQPLIFAPSRWRCGSYQGSASLQESSTLRELSGFRFAPGFFDAPGVFDAAAPYQGFRFSVSLLRLASLRESSTLQESTPTHQFTEIEHLIYLIW